MSLEPRGFNTAFGIAECLGVAPVGTSGSAGRIFTAVDNWKQHPGSMKNQGEWAFAAGINRFVYHTFQHQSLPDSLRPGMTMDLMAFTGTATKHGGRWLMLIIARGAVSIHVATKGRTVADRSISP